MCEESAKRFACVQAFPECPFPGSSVSSISYFLPCRAQCEQMKKSCGYSPNCDHFPRKDCALYLPEGFFPLNDDQGPYESLTGLYSFVLAAWILMTFGWCYATYVTYRETAMAMCRFVAVMPLLKSLTVMLGTLFWATCNGWGMCSYWYCQHSHVSISMYVYFLYFFIRID